MNETTRQYGKGTSLRQSFPWGLYRSGRAMCPDGIVRALARISQTADTFFSIPAAVQAKGKMVSGFVSMDDDLVLFTPYDYGKNASVFAS